MTTPSRSFLSIGECMIEMAQDASGLWRLGFAGDTLNTAWYFRACVPADWSVEYFTRLGRDAYSDRIEDFLTTNEIGAGWITRDLERQPGLYLIDLKDGERSFTYWRSQSAARLLADDETLLRDAVAAADIIYFSGITLAILAPDRRKALCRCIAEARNSGKTTVFDPNIRPRLWENVDAMRNATIQAASAAQIALPSFDDEQTIFGDRSLEDCASRYLGSGCTEVVVKNGGGPICAATPDDKRTIPDLDRAAPVDTTGAGDSFNGGYLAARAQGLPVEAAVRNAHSLAMLVVGRHGALIDITRIREARGLAGPKGHVG